MEKSEFCALLDKIFALNDFVVPPSADETEGLYSIWKMLSETGAKMNLTAITEESAVILRHFVDSLTVSKDIPPNSKVIDVGCGAGFPALPLALCRPDLEITAIDSTSKKINYVNGVARELGLKNLKAISLRAEIGAHQAEHKEKYDIVTARAVAALPMLSELCLPYCKVGGTFIAMKSKNADTELAEAERTINLCGGRTETRRELEITADGAEYEKRSLIIIKKVGKTPKIYPRNFSQISKKPL